MKSLRTRTNKTDWFDSLYNDYASVVYGMIQHSIHDEAHCAAVFKLIFLKAWKGILESPDESYDLKWMISLTQKEISCRKTELTLKELFTCRQSSN